MATARFFYRPIPNAAGNCFTPENESPAALSRAE
jgi:hypothetical protein